METKLYGTGAMARGAKCSEGTVRDAERRGLIAAIRDSAGRRLFTEAEMLKLRAHMAQRIHSTAARSQ